MKKLSFLIIGVLSMSQLMAQDISEALRYSSDDIQGTARFRSMSGAFGALGGDLSALSINPAGSSIFTRSNITASLSVQTLNNDVNYFGGHRSSSESKFDLNQVGAAFVFTNTNINSPWRKFVLAVSYDKVSNFENDWVASGTNTSNSIGSYFSGYAQGLRLDEISAFPGESYSEAYSAIGSAYGYNHQQAFLGYESYIIDPENDVDSNTTYISNIAPGSYQQRYYYSARGYNGKLSFNMSSQFKDKLYLGLNLNTHFINYERYTYLNESNNNTGSLINEVGFENGLYTIGTGFSFQLGAIGKLTEAFRLGLTYTSPTWYTIAEETTQYLETYRIEAGQEIGQVINPNIINIFPDYRLQTPGKFTGSLAYVFGDRGLLSFDYSIKDYSNTKFRPKSDPYFSSQNSLIRNTLSTASSYRVGGEYRIQRISLRAGYRFEESPYQNDSLYGDLNGYSFGIGYNFGNFKIDAAFDQSKQDINYQLYNVGLTDSALIDSKVSNFVVSLSFNL
ncbi:OmpP1/FadL family transporter [Mangrovimonas sp. YM274]|uniref:OmpP1/FadL family transporter n=1 Tax=Mangrovimonas sp. YM274 TaxID=3070660 RepID=UPI0027DD841C|nr:outer membrane protein transport protein [Mangrovimonas sp. YM274]WMI67931.1 outer membrane protein transport protein [Mangrovimonas sp. YM274]